MEAAEDDQGGRRGAPQKKTKYNSLCFKRKDQLQKWLQKNSRALGHELEEKEQEIQMIERDCSLGERILFTQTMPVHIKKIGK